ncbi:MAG: ABC transporter permease [Deltaproteobacteria bacterium]|nr:MAG: ABC transporter permease [Deltaproteobacteria bacterium]
MQVIKTILKRELASFFNSSTAYVVLVIFLVLQGFFTFYVTRLYEAGQADLQPFFNWFPWIFLFLIPAVTMKLFSDETRTGTIELLATLPVTTKEIVLGKFFAGWLFAAIAAACTFPVVITILYLGDPDTGAILSGYSGTILMAGAFTSIGLFSSSITKSQVISFLSAITISLFLLLAGHPPVIEALSGFCPDTLVNMVAGMSFLTHYNSMTIGVLDLRDIIYFFSIIIFMLSATTLIVNSNRN